MYYGLQAYLVLVSRLSPTTFKKGLLKKTTAQLFWMATHSEKDSAKTLDSVKKIERKTLGGLGKLQKL